MIRTAGRVLLGIVAAFLILRAVVELVTVDPARPESYRSDWGGPHYAGVLAVHVLPGVAALLIALVLLRRSRRPRSDA